MGDRGPQVIRSVRHRNLSALYAVMAAILFVVVLQFFLLMVALEGFAGTQRGVILPAAAGSGFCFVVACRLIRYVSAPRGGNSP